MPLQKVLEIVTDDPFSTLPVPFCTNSLIIHSLHTILCGITPIHSLWL